MDLLICRYGYLRREKYFNQGVGSIIAFLLLASCSQINQNRDWTFYLNPPALAASTAQSPDIAIMEAQVNQQINTIRQQQGLSPLRYNPKLAEVARRYSQRMAEDNFFDHVSPQGDNAVDRVKSAKIHYFLLGENLFMARNFPKPVSLSVKNWMASPSHRENVLRPKFQETGVGVWRKGNAYYFTQLFMQSQ